MCGIYAKFIKHSNISQPTNTETITATKIQQKEDFDVNCSTLKHRGPDYTETITIENATYTAYLCFHRLAINGINSTANHILQDDGVYLLCNGEIYNHVHLSKKYGVECTTGSDCEIILRLYLTNQLKIEELDGVFAFLIYNSKTHQIMVSRDRIGVRPLFKAMNVDTQTICFASEAKAMGNDPTTSHFRPNTMFELTLQTKKVKRDKNAPKKALVESDTNTIFSPGSITTVNKRSVPLFKADYTTTATIVRELLTAAVKKRLLSDRSIGFLVSGGLDSSLVASIAASTGLPIVSFSIGLEGSPDLLAADRVVEWIHKKYPNPLHKHHKVIITESDIVEAIRPVICACETFDITTIRASIPMYLIAQYIKQNTDVKVVLSGEGSDEVFGGYLYFHDAPSASEFRRETERLVDELYKYDVLRADRTISAHGLELRVPFLDHDFLNFVMGCDVAHMREKPMEKYLLRQAFEGYLPDSVLYRQKEAFSDGVGYNSVKVLKLTAKNANIQEVDHILPHTAESKFYYSLYNSMYGSIPRINIEHYWMPKWNETVDDPSATFLKSHGK